MKGIFEKGSPRSSKVRIPTILMMLKSKDPQGRNHPKHRAQLLQLQPGSCPSRRPRQSWQQVGKIIFNQRCCQIIERLTRISSPGEWDFYDESLSSPRSRLSLKPARNNIDCINGRLVARIWPFGEDVLYEAQTFSSERYCFITRALFPWVSMSQ